ncbi:hypothetical protein FOCC_FOCC014510 [Frankliniella occidentalis]|nr:hypothetical protein FOCC_FOCC014510 [Frankliniella occidentalis]
MASAEQLGLNKTWELSLYELHRTPQEAITDNTEIAVSPRSLHSELMCPICLDMLKKTMTTKECLHRFCSDCIVTALRSGNKECPTCRKKLVSKRSLRPDPNFDLLISKLYPCRDEYEAHQERVLEKLQKSSSQAAFLNSITEGIKLQSQHRQQRSNKKLLSENDATVNTPNPSAPTTPTPAQSGSDSQPPFQTPQSQAQSHSQIQLQPQSQSQSQAQSHSHAHSQSQSQGQSQPQPQPQTPLLPQSSVQAPSPHPPSPTPGGSQSSSSGHMKPIKRPKIAITSENDSASSSMEASGGHDTATEGEGAETFGEVELVFKPHPVEMYGNLE